MNGVRGESAYRVGVLSCLPGVFGLPGGESACCVRGVRSCLPYIYPKFG